MQSAVDGYTDGAAGGEDGGDLPFAGFDKERRQATIHTGAKVPPGLGSAWRNSSADPHRDYGFEQALEISTFGDIVARGFEGAMPLSNLTVICKQFRKTFGKHCFSLEFIEFVSDRRGREVAAGFPISVADELCGVPMAERRSAANSVKNDVAVSPVFSEQASLLFAQRGELVVVLR